MCIVTPVFNGADYIDETIESVLSQAGDFVLHYHIQDGGSTDGTMQHVRRWMKLKDKLPKVCAEVIFTCSSAPDRGMYDAINKGFASALPQGDDVVMGWIAADDRIAQGAFSAIANIRSEFPDVRFFGGRISLLDHTGSIIKIEPLLSFSRRCMAAGLYDGRAMPFIMQEGTFWCADLWRKVGGLDTGFRLAGDWDLWRRMAAHENYVCADTLLGFHRRRPGQLSEQMDRYYREIDDSLDQAGASLPEVVTVDLAGDALRSGAKLRAAYEAVAGEHEDMKSDPARFRNSTHSGTIVRFDQPSKRWERLDGFGVVPAAPEQVTLAGKGGSFAIHPTAGFLPPEGPYPEFGLPFGIRWARTTLAEGTVTLIEPGIYRVLVKCRTWIPDQTVVILDNGKPLGRLLVPPHGHGRDVQLALEGTFSEGAHVIGLMIEQAVPNDRYLLVIDWTIEQVPQKEDDRILPVSQQQIGFASQVGSPPTGEWPMISIVVPTRNQGHFIRDTLNSIIRQGYPNLELIVADGASTDETPRILRDYALHITHLISEPDTGQSDAINKGFRVANGDILSWLNSDDLLAEGALHAVAHAFMTSGADMVAGVCDVFDDMNRTVHRHLPCIADGPLPLRDLLDIENKWLRGQFFHQPEVFFNRRIWELVGGCVDESLFYSMDYDLWVKMARYGATIKVIGSTIAHYRLHPAQKTSTTEAYRPELTAHATRLRQEIGLPAMPAQGEVKHRLKIVIFNDFGFKYGAGIAHKRLGQALAAVGHVVVPIAYADFDLIRPTSALTPGEVADAIVSHGPDLVIIGNLHSIAADFDLLGALLPSGIPTIFYAHDQWIATGRCAYSGDCTRYLTLCNDACPTAPVYPALPRRRVAPAYRARRTALARAPDRHFAILTNSRHMQAFIEGALDPATRPPVHLAPLGIDVAAFKMGDRWRARMMLDLPQDRFIVITAAASLDDHRKGLSLLIDALEMVEDKAKILLLIMGFGEPVEGIGFDVRYSGYLTEEALVVLHYQAADILVGPSVAEAFGQVYIEAGACGTPSIAFDVGGVPDAILDGITGILVGELTARGLSDAIARLRRRPDLRRRLGAQARLHVANNYSVEASAAKLTAILVNEPALDLALSPTVVFAANPIAMQELQYLVEPDALPQPQLKPCWLPLKNLREEKSDDELALLPERFWWASWPGCRLMVRVDQGGPQTIGLKLRSDLEDQSLTVSVNSGPSQVFELPAGDFNVTRNLFIPTHMTKGTNVVDIRFSAQRDAARPAGRDLTLVIEELNLWGGSTGLRGGPKDGTCQLVEGFDAEEGPYPDMGLPHRFHWAIGQSCKLRVFSAFAGPRVWELKLRNPHPDQRLIIKIDNLVIGSHALPGASLQSLADVQFGVDVGAGFHTVTIESSQQLDSTTDTRPLAFIFEGLRLGPVGEAPAHIVDAVRWDLSSGVGPEQAPDVALGCAQPFRWFVSRAASFVIERSEAGPVDVSIKCRWPVAGQSALLTVNGQASRRLEGDGAPFAPGEWGARNLRLNRGQNLIELEFASAYSEPGTDRELFLLVESVVVEESGGLGDQALLGWECDTGFSTVEGPVPDLGLPKPFRWAVDGESVVRFSEPAKKVRLLVRNDHPNQILEISDGPDRVLSVALKADLALLQEVDIEFAGGGSAVLSIRPSIVGTGHDEDPRCRSFILEGVADGDGRLLSTTS